MSDADSYCFGELDGAGGAFDGVAEKAIALAALLVVAAVLLMPFALLVLGDVKGWK